MKPSKNKVPMREREISKRIKNFDEVPLGYSEEEAIAEADRCLQCKDPRCMEGCPVGIDIKGFIEKIQKREFEEGIKIIKEKNSLPAICGRVCPQEDQCEKECLLGKMKGYEPVAISRLERFLADLNIEKGASPEIGEKKDLSMAVIGSGPSGLTCASELAKMGYEVSLFEALHKAGGVLVYGIPEFRLPKSIVEREVQYIKSLGVKISLSTVVGKTLSLDELLEEFDSVYIATGAGLPGFLKIEGENLCGIYSANEFLTRVNLMKAYMPLDTPIIIKDRAAVFGAGNVAMDSARSALRLGAEEVTIIYRRSEKEMPARQEEIEHAKEEGIKFQLLTIPTVFQGSNFVSGVHLQRMRLGEPDESGRRRPIPIPDSEFFKDIDLAVIAIGQSPNPLLPMTAPKLKTDRKGRIIVNENMRSAIPGVYAGGDIVSGAATVIKAMGDGKNAALSMTKSLKHLDQKI